MPYVSTRLGRLFYEERGAARRPDDPPIFLLHGLLFDGGMWRHQIEPLSALGRVIVLDGPGHGRSERAPRFMLEEHADALEDVAGALGVGPRGALVVGLSWGGMVGLRLALQHPSRVAGLALLDASAEAETLKNRVLFRAMISMHRRVGLPLGLYEKEIAPRLFSRRAIAGQPALVEAAYHRAMGFDREGLCRASNAVVVHRSNVLPRIDRIQAPTLVVCGTEDRSTPPHKSENIARAIRGADLVLLQNVGHMSALEAPGPVNERLLPFVERCLGGA